MAEYAPTPADWLILVATCVLAIMFLHEAWENLVHRRPSRYGLDAAFVWLGIKFGCEPVRGRVRKATGNPHRMLAAGFYALCLGIGMLYVIFNWFRSFYFGG